MCVRLSRVIQNGIAGQIWPAGLESDTCSRASVKQPHRGFCSAKLNYKNHQNNQNEDRPGFSRTVLLRFSILCCPVLTRNPIKSWWINDERNTSLYPTHRLSRQWCFTHQLLLQSLIHHYLPFWVTSPSLLLLLLLPLILLHRSPSPSYCPHPACALFVYRPHRLPLLRNSFLFFMKNGEDEETEVIRRNGRRQRGWGDGGEDEKKKRPD